MKKQINYFLLSILFMAAFCCQTMAQSGVLWLGTKSLPADFITEVAKGNVPGHSIIHKFGHGNVGTTLTPISVALVYQTPTTATALEFVSADADDNATGDGAREVTITGIGADYDELTQVIATNGLTAVPIPIDFLRIYRWHVSASGVYASATAGSHEGVLTIRAVADTPVWSSIEASPFPAGQSEIGAYTVPDGYRAYVFSIEIDVDSAKAISVVMFKREEIDTVAAPFTPMRSMAHYIGIGGLGHPPSFPINSIPARTDIGFMGSVSSGNADISVQFEIMLVADGY